MATDFELPTNLTEELLIVLGIRKYDSSLKVGQFQVKPFVVSLLNHDRLNRPLFDRLRANG